MWRAVTRWYGVVNDQMARVLVVVAQVANAQAQLVSGLGGPAGFGEALNPSDDGVYLLEPGRDGGFDRTMKGVCLGQMLWDHVYVGMNGVVSFTTGVSNFDPTVFPQSARPPMIAPFWSDVDTRGPSIDGGNRVYYDLSPGQLVVTWLDVDRYAYTANRPQRNSFQLVLKHRPTLARPLQREMSD